MKVASKINLAFFTVACRASEFLDTKLDIIMLPFVTNRKHFSGPGKVFGIQASE